MRQNVQYLPKVAHSSYLEGLRKTGISIDTIPQMYGMNRILKEIGWAAVAVDGFIPPAAFMEFQAYNVLVIAADIRPITQIGYTPAPDIVHEAAGHAPIIADPEYAAYLVEFGKIGSKAFSSRKDIDLYEAIRLLSILKADPYTPPEEIRAAEEQLAAIEATISAPSELSLIRNLHWWTVEYGLIGTLKNPKIYGAGLLSSISESYNCLTDSVKKIPYTIAAAQTLSTSPPSSRSSSSLPISQRFPRYSKNLPDPWRFAPGDFKGERRESGQVATCVFSSGLQATGIIGSADSFMGEPSFIRFTSPVSLCYGNQEIPGQGKEYHSQGFSSPVGMIRDESMPLEQWSDNDLERFRDHDGFTNLVFLSGVSVRGKLRNILRKEGKIILITFTECTVSRNGSLFFRPEWGPYDMAVGASITSVYAGPLTLQPTG